MSKAAPAVQVGRCQANSIFVSMTYLRYLKHDYVVSGLGLASWIPLLHNWGSRVRRNEIMTFSSVIS